MEFIGVFFFPLIGFFMLFFPEDIFEIVNSRKMKQTASRPGLF